MKTVIYFIIIFFVFYNSIFAQTLGNWFAPDVIEISLNGNWEVGTGRKYDRIVKVPGLATDPRKINEDTLWYRRQVNLPKGNWTHAKLILNGASFCPTVFVNGQKVSEMPGGITITEHLLECNDVSPGKKILLEIELKSLKDVDPRDASKIPMADRWRTNVSSCLWDGVMLHLYGSAQIKRLIPFYDFKTDQVRIKWKVENHQEPINKLRMRFEILDQSENIVVQTHVKRVEPEGSFSIDLDGMCQQWSPENPKTYRLRAILQQDSKILDVREITLGLREFRIEGLEFFLNDKPEHLRGGSVVWHRWLRDPEARELAFDVEWFEKNIVERLKSYGANFLRFPLSMPPEAILDLCDKHGLMVQAEWNFFHGMEASEESLTEQWQNWLDLCMRHPSIVLIHPWNETQSPRLKIAWSALDKILPEYPPLVLAHRDVIHIHKYWWSLFENLGLYYDSYMQFDRPIMVDEIGGNYLDGEANPGRYPTVNESFLRFLGRDHTKKMRLEHQCKANARVAEYWRRIGAAGFAAFCILGSPEDGNHWFLGPLKDAKPKPVWDALAASWSPISVSLEVWDCNYETDETVNLPLYFLNDTDDHTSLVGEVVITPETDTSQIISKKQFSVNLLPHDNLKSYIKLKLPSVEGAWQFRAILQNPPNSVKHPVVSSWRFRTLLPKIPKSVYNLKIGIPDCEKELEVFLNNNGFKTCKLDDPKAKILLTSKATWGEITKNKEKIAIFENAISRGCSVVMLDIGPMYLGKSYPKHGELSPLEEAYRLQTPEIKDIKLLDLNLRFTQVAESESHLHPSDMDDALWENLDKEATWLWNGMRGGLIVPAIDMEITGLRQDAFISSWVSRGADTSLIKGKNYFAYELQGFYAYSTEGDDKQVKDALKEKVKFLVEDAPALQYAVNPRAQIRIVNLSQSFRASQKGKAEEFIPLANCGKNLTQTPIVKIDFGKKKGTLILSQLITAGRLAKGFGEEGLYGIRYDPAAVQFVLNILNESQHK